MAFLFSFERCVCRASCAMDSFNITGPPIICTYIIVFLIYIYIYSLLYIYFCWAYGDNRIACWRVVQHRQLYSCHRPCSRPVSLSALGVFDTTRRRKSQRRRESNRTADCCTEAIRAVPGTASATRRGRPISTKSGNKVRVLPPLFFFKYYIHLLYIYNMRPDPSKRHTSASSFLMMSTLWWYPARFYLYIYIFPRHFVWSYTLWLVIF